MFSTFVRSIYIYTSLCSSWMRLTSAKFLSYLCYDWHVIYFFFLTVTCHLLHCRIMSYWMNFMELRIMKNYLWVCMFVFKLIMANNSNIRKWPISWISSAGDQSCWCWGIVGWACEQPRLFPYSINFSMIELTLEGFSQIYVFFLCSSYCNLHVQLQNIPAIHCT